MTELIQVHPDNPQPRLLRQAADVLHAGGIIAYPTDSAYALGCALANKQAIEKLRRIRGIDDKHFLTLVCRDLSEISTYARVKNDIYRLLKAHTPGPFTFILPATREVPRYFQQPKRKALGLRIPDCQIVLDLLAEYGSAIASTTLILPGDVEPLYDPAIIFERLECQVDLIIGGGFCDVEPTTVVDCCADEINIVRQGKGVL